MEIIIFSYLKQLSLRMPVKALFFRVRTLKKPNLNTSMYIYFIVLFIVDMLQSSFSNTSKNIKHHTFGTANTIFSFIWVFSGRASTDTGTKC